MKKTMEGRYDALKMVVDDILERKKNNPTASSSDSSNEQPELISVQSGKSN
jgi:hypothetical protein